jgi:hypothetical protein
MEIMWSDIARMKKGAWKGQNYDSNGVSVSSGTSSVLHEGFSPPGSNAMPGWGIEALTDTDTDELMNTRLQRERERERGEDVCRERYRERESESMFLSLNDKEREVGGRKGMAD